MRRCSSKTCAKKGQLLRLNEFGKDKHSPDGLNRKCKKCIAAICKSNRSKSKAQRVRIEEEKNIHQCHRLNDPKLSPKYEKYELEATGQRLIVVAGREQGAEVRQWQDGTRSDFGIRPLGCSIDLWVPQQLKVSSAPHKPLTFYGCKDYACGIVCIAPCLTRDRVYAFSGGFVTDNESRLSGGNIRIGTRTSVWDTGLYSMDEYFADQLRAWHSGIGVYPERTLRLQASANSVTEWMMRELAVALDSSANHEDVDIRNGVSDRLMNGMRIQDKCAGPSRQGAKGLVARLCHTHASMPYRRGDNDLYCFHYLWKERGLYLQWMIPENEMVRHGVVSEIDHDTGIVTSAGSGTIQLHAAVASDEEESLVCIQRELMNGWPRGTTYPWTAEFIRVVEVEQ